MLQRGYAFQPNVAASATLGRRAEYFSTATRLRHSHRRNLQIRRNRIAVGGSNCSASQGSRATRQPWAPSRSGEGTAFGRYPSARQQERFGVPTCMAVLLDSKGSPCYPIGIWRFTDDSHGQAIASQGQAIVSQDRAIISHGQAIASHDRTIVSHGQAIVSQA
jgi:hypothetical protein